MARHPRSLVIPRQSLSRVPELLQLHGISCQAQRPINEFEIFRCEREGFVALLSVSQPAHWAAAAGERRELIVLGAMGESMFRFWRFPRETRLAQEVIDLLRSLEAKISSAH